MTTSKVQIDVDQLRLLARLAEERGTLPEFSKLAIEWAEGATAYVEEQKVIAEQYRKNWLALQDITGEQCLDLAIAKDRKSVV